MKFAVRVLSIAVLLSLTMFYISCDPEPPKKKPDTEVQFEKLSGTWTVVSATLDNAPPALDHSSMTLTIGGSPTGMTFTVAGRPAGPSAWPASGVFTFGTDVSTQLVRDDDVTITYSVTESSLVLDFTFNGDPYTAGRVTNVSGSWHFEFTK
jgi:hypothetical protein